jgi:hypothetical protein
MSVNLFVEMTDIIASIQIRDTAFSRTVSSRVFEKSVLKRSSSDDSFFKNVCIL